MTHRPRHLPRWTLRAHRATTLHCMVCDTCAARSDEEPDPEPGHHWALTHTRYHPHHRDYYQHTTSAWSTVNTAPT